MANYNCAFEVIDDFHAYHDLFYLLMIGSGVGVRVLKEDAQKLPRIRANLEIVHKAYTPRPVDERLEYTNVTFSGDTVTLAIGDSKEGWAQAIDHYFQILTNQEYSRIRRVIVEYDSIRPRGERLKVFGGTASGYESMMTMLDKIHRVIRSAGSARRQRAHAAAPHRPSGHRQHHRRKRRLRRRAPHLGDRPHRPGRHRVHPGQGQPLPAGGRPLGDRQGHRPPPDEQQFHLLPPQAHPRAAPLAYAADALFRRAGLGQRGGRPQAPPQFLRLQPLRRDPAGQPRPVQPHHRQRHGLCQRRQARRGSPARGAAPQRPRRPAHDLP